MSHDGITKIKHTNLGYFLSMEFIRVSYHMLFRTLVFKDDVYLAVEMTYILSGGNKIAIKIYYTSINISIKSRVYAKA